MSEPIQGTTTAEGLHFAVVSSRFNEPIASDLVEGAVSCLTRHGADPDAIEVVRVPGAFEIPMAAQKIIGLNRFDAVITTGVLIRGDTPHFDFISAQVTQGISEVAVRSGVPVTFGVITCDTHEQALQRSGKASNKGWEAALAAMEMANLYRRLTADTGD